MKLIMAYPVDPAAADRWLRGREAPSDTDLLDSAVDKSEVLYVARMHSAREWRLIWEAIRGFNASKVIFRTRCPGLVRLAQKAGALFTFEERNGALRVLFSGEAFAFTSQRFQKLFA